MFSLNKLSPTITNMIRFDHSHVMVTFHQYERDKRPTVKKALADTICDALEIHATLEEEIFYPVMRQRDAGEPFIHKAEPEHMEMRRMIAELRRTDGADPRHDKLVMELMRDVMHHVADEETTLLPHAEAMLSKDALSELGAQMTLPPPATGRPESRQAGQEPCGRLLRQRHRPAGGPGQRRFRSESLRAEETVEVERGLRRRSSRAS